MEELLAEYDIALIVEDKRVSGQPIEVQFRGELTPMQEKAAKALLEHDAGVFVAPPGTGKTVLGTYLIAARGCSTLVLVHRRPLLDQWLTQLSLFLDLPSESIGQIGGGRSNSTGQIDVAMLQSLVRDSEVKELVKQYGHMIIDECHHVPAVSFERLLSDVKARYITGLTATPQRRDGQHPILAMQIGPARFVVDSRSQVAARPFDHRLIARETEFRMVGEDVAIQELYQALVCDENRNQLILNDVIRELEDRRSPILLTERRDHLEYFAEKLRSFARHLVVLQGGMSEKQRREVAEQLRSIPDHEERLVLATGRFIGEGFDDARLDTLFLASPLSWKGTLTQYAGRLHRLHSGKTEVRIYDYVDSQVPVLKRMFEKRLRTYRALGYAVSATSTNSEGVAERTIEWDQEAPYLVDDSF